MGSRDGGMRVLGGKEEGEGRTWRVAEEHSGMGVEGRRWEIS